MSFLGSRVLTLTLLLWQQLSSEMLKSWSFLSVMGYFVTTEITEHFLIKMCLTLPLS